MVPDGAWLSSRSEIQEDPGQNCIKNDLTSLFPITNHHINFQLKPKGSAKKELITRSHMSGCDPWR